MAAVPKPQELRRGPRWLRAAFAARDKWVESMEVRAGRNVDIHEDATGKLVHAQPGGGAASIRPFQLVGSVDNTDPITPVYNIRVVYSTLDGAMPAGFTSGDTTPFVLTAPSSLTEGSVYVKTTRNTTTGAVIARNVGIDPTGVLPPSDATLGEFYAELGTFYIDASAKTIAVINSGYGPVTSCRNWFTTPADYTFRFSDD